MTECLCAVAFPLQPGGLVLSKFTSHCWLSTQYGQIRYVFRKSPSACSSCSYWESHAASDAGCDGENICTRLNGENGQT